MRKAKLMLIVITVFATVGAGLAFKVKNKGSFSYCFTDTNTEPEKGECIWGACNKEAKPYLSGTKIYYTATYDCSKCREVELSCPNVAELPFNN